MPTAENSNHHSYKKNFNFQLIAKCLSDLRADNCCIFLSSKLLADKCDRQDIKWCPVKYGVDDIKPDWRNQWIGDNFIIQSLLPFSLPLKIVIVIVMFKKWISFLKLIVISQNLHWIHIWLCHNQTNLLVSTQALAVHAQPNKSIGKHLLSLPETQVQLKLK